MEHIITRRRGFRKLLAFLLCMASILGLLPAQAFAMSVGQTASSWLGDQYVGSDGNHYRAPAPYTYLAYHADGTIDVHTSSGGNAYRHYMLTDSDGISHQVYCVESGIPYGKPAAAPCIYRCRRTAYRDPCGKHPDPRQCSGNQNRSCGGTFPCGKGG